MKRRAVLKWTSLLAALVLAAGAAAVTVFAQSSPSEGVLVEEQHWDNGFSVTYAYDVAAE